MSTSPGQYIYSVSNWYPTTNCSGCPGFACPAGCTDSHQFDAIGYDCGSCDYAGGALGGNLTDITISIAKMSGIGTHGFAILLYNAISSIKFEPGSSSSDWGALTPAYEDIQVKDCLQTKLFINIPRL